MSALIHKLKHSELLKHGGIFMLFNILDKMVPFLVLPIISRILTVEEMGFYILFQAVYNFMLPVITLNSDSAIMLNHYHLDANRFKSYFSSGVCVFFLTFICCCLGTLLFIEQLESFLNFDISILYIIYLICLFYFFNRINLNIWQKEKKPINYGVFTILLTIVKNIFILIFIFYLPQYSWFGIVYSQLISQFIFFGYSFIFLYKRGLINLKFNKIYFKEVIRIGYPLTLHQLGAWSGNLASRLIINAMIGTMAAGHFGIGATFGIIMTLIQDSFNKAFTPFLYERLKMISLEEIDSKIASMKGKLVKLTYIYNIGLLLFAFFISLIGYYGVEFIFGPQYETSKVYIFWVVFGAAFNGMYKMHIGYMFYSKKTKGIASITITTGIINLCLCYLLIRFNGNAVGAAQAIFTSQFLSYILSWKKSNNIYPMPWFNKSNVI